MKHMDGMGRLKRFAIAVAILLALWQSSVANAQILSSETIFSPSSSSLISGASCIGFHVNNWTTFYMRYSDSAYLCGADNGVIWSSYSFAFKMTLPQNFVITDFKKLLSNQGCIGSYGGCGMHSIIHGYGGWYPTNNLIKIFKLPAVSELQRIATIYANTDYGHQVKAYATAVGPSLSKAPPQSYILEFYADGVGYLAPYRYAPLAYDHATGEQEVADDVIMIDDYVIFATRDTRAGHAPVNLRISDTVNALILSDLKTQRQFSLPSYETVCSKIRLQYLENDLFMMAYTIYNTNTQKYFLCLHRINLADFLSGINTMVSYEIPINTDFCNLMDVTYEPDVNTMVLLLNNAQRSELYHIDPFSTASNTVCKLSYDNGKFTSLDTLGYQLNTNADMYVAIGDSLIFRQDISTGAALGPSCLPMTKVMYSLRESPTIALYKDPFISFTDDKSFDLPLLPSIFFEGTTICSPYLKDQDDY